MADDLLILDLVQEALDSGRSPEDLCRDCPGLLTEVRERVEECRQINARLEALFPSSAASEVGSREPSLAPDTFPKIPGYTVESVLGHGGVGVVYRATHLKLHRVVALKMLLSGAYAKPAEIMRFMREAQAIAGLHHANIVQVYDSGEWEGKPYFTMEYLEGGDLGRKLAGVPLPPMEAARVAALLADAVHVAHCAGIVHRDLKPANVLLAADRTPKITDFGLARRAETDQTLTQSGARVGTPSYMAPEQAKGHTAAIGPPADIYAVGTILYEMLTGRPPFRGDSAAETERQVINEEPARPSKLNAKVPRDLETICLKCLQKESARRYETAAALAEDLGRFREGRPIRARPVRLPERAWRWSKRNPTGAALVVTALALGTMASAGGIWFVRQRAEQRAEAVRLRNETATALAQAVSFRKGFHFQEAREVLEATKQRLEPAGPDDLRRPVAQGLADLNLVEQLDAARFQGAMIVRGNLDPTRPEPFYASAFAQAGLGRQADDSASVAARVRHSSVRAEIVDALDDWASLTTDPARRKWLFEIARQADPDPERDRLRQSDLWPVPGGDTQPIPELNADKISPRMATALARLMRTRGVEAIASLAVVQARAPQDFWLNIELSTVLFRVHRLDEALGYARSALALRPHSGAAHNAVGTVLLEMGRVDEAMDQCRLALDLDPNYAEAHYNLGEALRSKGKMDGAIGHLRKAIATNPMLIEAYIDLAVVMQSSNQLDEAVNLLKKAIGLDSRNAKAHNNLGTALRLQDRPDEAIAQYREAVNIDPRYAIGQFNLGEALWVKGQLDEAIEHIQQSARLDPPNVDAQIFLCDHLYAAGRAAVRETIGQRVGKPRLDEMARANLRLRALDWLRASLNLATKLVDNGRGQATSLMTWESEPVLASVRDPGALARLPNTEREQWRRFWAVVAAEIVTDPLTQARERAAHHDWAEAASLYARTLARGPINDGHFWFEYAAVQLLSGDRAGYATAFAELIARFGTPDGPRAYHVARAGTLAADPAPDASLLRRLAGSELQSNATQFWSLTEQGALAYRAGRFQDAVPLFERSLQANPKPGVAVLNWLWLAMAEQRLGKTDEARGWLEKAQKWLDQYRNGITPNAEAESGLHLHNWLEAQVLRREAEAMILPNLKAFMDGMYQPQNNDERLAFLAACQFGLTHTNTILSSARCCRD